MLILPNSRRFFTLFYRYYTIYYYLCIQNLTIQNKKIHNANKVQGADVSFLMISKNYKESEICLNEMGAVWATDNRVRHYLLPNVDLKKLDGCVIPTKLTNSAIPLFLMLWKKN